MSVYKHINGKNDDLMFLKKKFDYITDSGKTRGGTLVGTFACFASHDIKDWLTVKKIYHKTGGRQGEHIVLSPLSDLPNVSDEAYMNLAYDVAKTIFSRFNCVYAVHVDSNIRHIHFLLNSVSYKDGKRFHSSKSDLATNKAKINKILQKHHFDAIKTSSDMMIDNSPYDPSEGLDFLELDESDLFQNIMEYDDLSSLENKNNNACPVLSDEESDYNSKGVTDMYKKINRDLNIGTVETTQGKTYTGSSSSLQEIREKHKMQNAMRKACQVPQGMNIQGSPYTNTDTTLSNPYQTENHIGYNSSALNTSPQLSQATNYQASQFANAGSIPQNTNSYQDRNSMWNCISNTAPNQFSQRIYQQNQPIHPSGLTPYSSVQSSYGGFNPMQNVTQERFDINNYNSQGGNPMNSNTIVGLEGNPLPSTSSAGVSIPYQSFHSEGTQVQNFAVEQQQGYAINNTNNNQGGYNSMHNNSFSQSNNQQLPAPTPSTPTSVNNHPSETETLTTSNNVIPNYPTMTLDYVNETVVNVPNLEGFGNIQQHFNTNESNPNLATEHKAVLAMVTALHNSGIQMNLNANFGSRTILNFTEYNNNNAFNNAFIDVAEQ